MARLTVDLPDEQDRLIEEIARKEHLTKAQALRRAVTLLRIYERERQEGRALAVIDPEHDRILKEIVTA